MKKAILLCGMLLAASATLASAAGINFRWDACFGDGGVQNKTFACNINSPASVRMIGSFVLDADLADVSGTEMVVDLQAGSPTLPAWIAAWGTGTNCFDWASGQATVAIAAYQLAKHGLPNEARILSISAVPVSALGQLFGTFEYSTMALSVNELATVGTGSCEGCSTPVCLVYNSVNITTSGNLNNTLLTQEASPGSNICTWQGGAIGGNGCPGATPTRNATWGSVKALYR